MYLHYCMLPTHGSTFVTRWEENREKIMEILFLLFWPSFSVPQVREENFLWVLSIWMFTAWQECILITKAPTQDTEKKKKKKKRGKRKEKISIYTLWCTDAYLHLSSGQKLIIFLGYIPVHLSSVVWGFRWCLSLSQEVWKEQRNEKYVAFWVILWVLTLPNLPIFLIFQTS